ncbi:rhodanese-related sulfurtransferase [Kribbella orskensis]|uniref:Rhodanese-related sulfurtransferase n=1 Tax=Kribbella orskensis TaxID=2512216 RepID=A0ABY2B6L4_9ACTN|nr:MULTISPECIES: metalloregulator ArsR/SmtB family transcription factor [Kribbella]TCN28370.1 rhodanese-related sulfurtransferase [Kribbella sp. VKM Ac-2500]TCO08112.1 rhodanese-related sulfurtransferase [Kribbella orskensis]
MGDQVAKAALFEQFAQVGKALGSAKRLELLDLLAQGERSVEVLAGRAGLGLTTASNHLQLLRRAGLVVARKDGTKVYYRLAGGDVAALWGQLRDVASVHLAEVERARRAYLGNDDVAEVTRDELLRRLEAGDVTVVDVRPGEEYAAGHIPGAVSIPVDELADRLAELPAGTTIVAYCRGSYCVMAHEAVRTLTAGGRSAARLSEGMLEWRLAELPVAS